MVNIGGLPIPGGRGATSRSPDGGASATQKGEFQETMSCQEPGRGGKAVASATGRGNTIGCVGQIGQPERETIGGNLRAEFFFRPLALRRRGEAEAVFTYPP